MSTHNIQCHPKIRKFCLNCPKYICSCENCSYGLKKEFKTAVKYVHKVLVNRLGGLSLPRKSVVRLTDMTLDV